MKFHANYGEAELLQLKAAILLYGGSSGMSFASVHEPYKDAAGAPYLDAGRPITVDFLRTLAHELGMRMRAEILPEEVLVHTPEIIAWWVPALRRPMFFSETCDGKTLSGKIYPHPPLVFAVKSRQLAIRALMVNERPKRTSVLAVAPYWNTSENGGVCLGSAHVPTGTGVLDNLDGWVEGFFKSEFSHSNAAKLTSHPEGHLGLWRDLAREDRFPPEWLVPAGTLEQWLCPR